MSKVDTVKLSEKFDKISTELELAKQDRDYNNQQFNKNKGICKDIHTMNILSSKAKASEAAVVKLSNACKKLEDKLSTIDKIYKEQAESVNNADKRIESDSREIEEVRFEQANISRRNRIVCSKVGTNGDLSLYEWYNNWAEEALVKLREDNRFNYNGNIVTREDLLVNFIMDAEYNGYRYNKNSYDNALNLSIRTDLKIQEKDLVKKLVRFDKKAVERNELRKMIELNFCATTQDLELTEELIKHIMCNVKRKLLDLDVSYSMSLILKSLEQGTGKSSLLALLTKPFKSLVVRTNFKDLADSRSKSELYASAFCIIDELEGISKVTTDALKQCVDSKYVNARILGSNRFELVPNKTTILGSANIDMLSEKIKDSTGLRRFLPVQMREVKVLETLFNDINNLDYEDMWLSIDPHKNYLTDDIKEGFFKMVDNHVYKDDYQSFLIDNNCLIKEGDETVFISQTDINQKCAEYLNSPVKAREFSKLKKQLFQEKTKRIDGVITKGILINKNHNLDGNI